MTAARQVWNLDFHDVKHTVIHILTGQRDQYIGYGGESLSWSI